MIYKSIFFFIQVWILLENEWFECDAIVERVLSLKGANDGIFLDDELVFEDGQDPTSLGKKFHMMNWCIFVCYARIRKTFELEWFEEGLCKSYPGVGSPERDGNGTSRIRYLQCLPHNERFTHSRTFIASTLVSQVDDVGEGTAGIDGRNGELWRLEIESALAIAITMDDGSRGGG